MKRFRLLPALLLLGPLALVGCDANDPGDDAPALIAPAAFSADVESEFPSASRSARGEFGQNWFQGAARVGIVSFAVGVHLIVPALVTDAATDVAPYVESGTWIWENTVAYESSTVTYRLEATPDGRETAWRMLISASALGGESYDTFELYNATTSLDGRSGTWRLYYEVEGERTEVLDAEFDVTSETDREITFTVPDSNPNPDAAGEVIHYKTDGDLRLFEWHQEPEDIDHVVEWDEATHAGSVTADDYNDGERACWDESLDDVPCD